MKLKIKNDVVKKVIIIITTRMEKIKNRKEEGGKLLDVKGFENLKI